MKEQHKDHLDPLIQEMLEQELDQSPSPSLSKEEAWKRINKELRHRKDKKFQFFRRKRFYAVAIMFAMIGMLVFLPQNGDANSKLTDIFHEIRGSVQHIFMNSMEKSDELPDVPLPDEEYIIVDDVNWVTKELSLEEAQEETAFKIVVPKEVPSEYAFEKAIIHKPENELSEEVTLHYMADEKEFYATQKVISETDFSMGMTTADDTEVKEVEVNGLPARLLIFKDASTEIIWMTQQYYFHISGHLTEDQIYSVASSY
ncbi:DUF4367 domain-containing protein [Ornithinibacillus sp. L9]|uniref:DUF4367 domain-containing protein n=1 Tax=Ornithinibacillus caprae TaxID=2678566 RepID=A0A6N8FQI7_9BACI|nr:DUF4367 domain-containing protein [Ornithinibacillus caprae]MUK90607.1 DUF4367 domain-containing protein [Ornithinibacillus caprae]